jgi:hypothetical protein
MQGLHYELHDFTHKVTLLIIIESSKYFDCTLLDSPVGFTVSSDESESHEVIEQKKVKYLTFLLPRSNLEWC